MAYSAFQEYYSDNADRMDTHWRDFSQVQYDWILNRLKILFPLDKAFSVMDLGCGTGELLSQIAKIFPEAKLSGVDGTRVMVQKSVTKLQSRAVIIQSDLEDFELSQRYDVIISSSVIHHLKSPFSHLEKIGHGLSHDGHAFISDIAINTYRLYFAQIWWSLTQKSYKHSWDERAFRKLVKSSGLSVINGAILKPDDFWRLQIYHLQDSYP